MKRIQKRFDQLSAVADEIVDSLKIGTVKVPSSIQYLDAPTSYYDAESYNLDTNKYHQWHSSVEALLVQVFGKDFPHYINFVRPLDGNRHECFHFHRSILLAAKDDYENGYIFDVRFLVSAKVFSDELEQAEELLKKKHTTAAAVIAGTVLETTIRELAQQNGVDLGSVNKMNSDLAKEGVYNDAMKDQIQAWYKLRNNAAHGKPDEFTESQVEVMIQGIRNFVAEQMK